MTFALQPGTTSVYKILPISNTYDPKRGQIESWVGLSVNGEKSSPTTGSHTLTDADAGRGCFAFRAGECRTDSAANDYFAVIPNLDTAKTRCHASQITYPSACVLASVSTQAHVVQMRLGDDPQGRQQRIVSDSSTRPGSQYVYTHARQFPDSICLLSTVHHLAGWFTGPVLICPGGWPEDAVNRTTYTQFFVSVPANSIVEFGLDPQFRCKYNAGTTAGRDEVCKVSAATIVEATPFKFLHETLTATVAEQMVQLPFQSGNIYYHRVVTAGVPGPTQAVAVP